MKVALTILFTALAIQAQQVRTPGLGPSNPKLTLTDSQMSILSSNGIFQKVTSARVQKTIDFNRQRDLFTVTLFVGEESVETLEFEVVEATNSICGAPVLVGVSTRRLPGALGITVTDPSIDCGTEKAKAVITSSLGLTGMIDGTIEMEGFLASPF